jgi:hypothetical protein
MPSLLHSVIIDHKTEKKIKGKEEKLTLCTRVVFFSILKQTQQGRFNCHHLQATFQSTFLPKIWKIIIGMHQCSHSEYAKDIWFENGLFFLSPKNGKILSKYLNLH